MNRITATFEKLKAEGRKGLVGYLTAGDPDPETSLNNILAAIDSGLDVLELGVPFSDPTADGRTIQEASQRALAGGMSVAGVLSLVRRVREHSQVPIVLFGYVNPFFRYGYERIAADAAEAGADGMLIVDLPFEESGEMREHLDRHGLFLIPLVAPTTGTERAAAILAPARGFVYYIMVTGVTGARSEVAADIGEHVKPLRELTSLPIAVGFGVSDGEQAARAAAPADAVVVGSAIVQAALDGRVSELVGDLRSGLDRSTTTK